MAAACAKLGIPLEVRTGRRLADDPAVRRLQAFLEMVARDWMRDDVIAFLKIGCGPGARLGADWLQRRARRKAVRVGRDAWRDLLSEPDIATRAQVEELVRALQWDAALRSGPRDASEWVQALGPVVESLLPGAPDGRGKPGSIRRALDAALTDVQRASAITSRGPSGFAAFQRDLVAVLRSVPLPPRPRPDAVALLDANESRERDIACAAVTGLVEKVYPRRVNEDPFFRDDERDALSRGGLELEPRRNGVDEERLLFYTNITAPKQRLLLSYPRASAEQDALRSFYLDEVETALGGLPATTRRLDDVAPRPEDCVDDRDRVLSACSLLSADEDECGAPDADALRSRISARGIPVDDAALLRVIRVLSTRSLPRAPSLASAASARAYSERRPYRVTEIETYAECPFRHFAQYGLRLRPDEDGVTRASAGSVYHGVLRRYFRGRAGSGSADADTIQKALGADLASVLADTVVDAAGFRRRLFDRSLADALGGFAGREARLRDVFGMEPSRFELAFGPRAGGDSGEDGGPPDDDPASDVQPLRIEQPGGPQIELCGTIDRVDLDDDGKRALVLDYKLGNAPEYREIEAGQSIQLPLYVLAAEQVFGFVGVGACYDTPREKGRPRFFRRQHADERRLGPVPDMDDGRHVRPLTEGQFAELVERAREVVRAVVAGIACGGIAPVPGDHCDYCPYSGICRTTAGPDHDGEPLPLGSAAPEPVT
jgi:ATP-dependent helicase/nuclease subunit B